MKYLHLLICAVTLLNWKVEGLSFPFLVPKDYAYSQQLPIKASTLLYPSSGSDAAEFSFTSKGSEGKEKKVLNKDGKQRYITIANPNFDFREHLPFCFLPPAQLPQNSAPVVEKSRVAEMIYANSEIMETRMDVRLK